MPTSLSCEEILDVVRENGLVEEESLAPFLDEWNQATDAGQSRDPEQFAEGLANAGLITNFQKQQLLAGKRRGFVIADKYILLQHLGAGGMGSVWLCQHKVMRRRVAIKVLPQNFAKDPEYLARFHREARAAAALDHPNIVRAFDVDHDEKMHFLVMEYVEGRSFQDLVEETGPLTVAQAADYIAQAALGLQHAHESGLVHRDIKPGNLLIDRRGTVKILDMGLALFFQEEGQSLTQQFDANAVLGTAEYLAPEQAINSHGVDIRADIYSLGLTFFFLLTGRSPYGEEGTIAQKLIWHQLRAPKSVRELRPEVPEALDAIIVKMLAKDREERYQTPDEVAKALGAWARQPADPPSTQTLAELKSAAGKKSSPSNKVSRGSPETLRASDADTAVEKPSSAIRPDKKPKSDASIRDDKRKGGKSGKSDSVADDSRIRGTVRKKGDSTDRLRRSKKSSTSPALLFAGIGGGLFLVLTLAAAAFFVLRGPTDKPTVPIAQTSDKKADDDKDSKASKVDPVPQPVPSEKKPEEKKVEPSDVKKAETKTPAKKDRTPTPTKKTPETGSDPTPPVKPEVKAPPPKQKEPLADFFPKAGTTLFYNGADYNSKAVTRQKWDFKDDGVINITYLQLGVMEKGTLLKNGQAKWLKPLKNEEQLHFRQSDTHIEIGHPIRKSNTTVWEPVLPLAASVKDSWAWTLPSGETKTYTVTKFQPYKNKRSVVIQDSVPTPQGGKVVTVRTFVQGVGEVTRTQSLENPPSPPQLLGELKLLDE